MPTSLLIRVTCDHCNRRFFRKNMSALDGVCLGCYESNFAACNDCGGLIRFAARGARHGSRANYFNSDIGRTRPVCNECWCAIQYPRDGLSWMPTPFNVSIATYQKIKSKRKFGVEIETSRCDDYRAQKGKTIFGCKDDCTIGGREFDSPILYGDEGLAAICAFTDVADKTGWGSHSECGTHIHYDMRDETDEALYRIAYAYAITYTFWAGCVPFRRRSASYCHGPCYDGRDVMTSSGVTSFDNFCGRFDRYDYINLLAYGKHKTFENRLLEGSINGQDICNWIIIHARFIDYVKNLEFWQIRKLLQKTGATEASIASNAKITAAVTKITNEPDLSDWLVNRIKQHAPPTMNYNPRENLR